MIRLDDIDRMLINDLQNDSKQSIKQLAEKVNLSITPVHERLKKIEASGIIQKYVAIVDPELAEKNLIVYCQVTLVKHQGSDFEKFEAYIDALDDVLEVYYIAGNYDLLLKILLKDMKAYEELILQNMSRLDIISHIQSSFVIRQIKNETKIKL
ncbi:Lrp/AsnC family transcriptional regulator [Mangrovimonas xylaniphaga]|uniref:Lrp/AsnC family transcriptional regulator n=1 Tax=Mangrovimonas xylaniphaga TaxID=1645915 RepID=UPI0006B48F69|nr:Lrp/AsnC family transcriptional regulator [Mangrovimonas xylaniphaga]